MLACGGRAIVPTLSDPAPSRAVTIATLAGFADMCHGMFMAILGVQTRKADQKGVDAKKRMAFHGTLQTSPRVWSCDRSRPQDGYLRTAGDPNHNHDSANPSHGPSSVTNRN